MFLCLPADCHVALRTSSVSLLVLAPQGLQQPAAAGHRGLGRAHARHACRVWPGPDSCPPTPALCCRPARHHRQLHQHCPHLLLGCPCCCPVLMQVRCAGRPAAVLPAPWRQLLRPGRLQRGQALRPTHVTGLPVHVAAMTGRQRHQVPPRRHHPQPRTVQQQTRLAGHQHCDTRQQQQQLTAWHMPELGHLISMSGCWWEHPHREQDCTVTQCSRVGMLTQSV